MKQALSSEIDIGLYSRRPRERFTQARVIRALQRAAQQQSGVALGVTKRAAQRLGCAESTVRSYIKKYPKVAAAKIEIETTWQARVDEMLAEINARRRGRTSPNALEHHLPKLKELTRHWHQKENLQCGK